MDPLRPGLEVGEYLLEAPLGQGGMGSVYRARHVSLDFERAIKLVAISGPRADDRVERFLREARMLARLDPHPGVVGVHEHGTWGAPHPGHAYCVLDLVRGADLQRAMQSGGACPVPRALELGAALADALGHVHAAGIVHRDLKPANVLLREGDGAPVLTDFGIAHDETEESLTRTGQVLGTAGYMAPEQAWGGRGEVGPWSDVFALGVLLYELVAGAMPHAGETHLELTRAKASGIFPPLKKLRSELPADLAWVVEGCLAPEPGARPTATQVAAALRAIARGEPVEPWAPRQVRQVLWALLGLVAMLLLLTGGALWLREGRERAAQAKQAQHALKDAAEVVEGYELEARRWRLGLAGQPDAAPLEQVLETLRPQASQEVAQAVAALEGVLTRDAALARRAPDALEVVGGLVDVPGQRVTLAALLAGRADAPGLRDLLAESPAKEHTELCLHLVAALIGAGDLQAAATELTEARAAGGDETTRDALRLLGWRLEIARAVEQAGRLEARPTLRALQRVAAVEPELAREGVAAAAQAALEASLRGAGLESVVEFVDALCEGPWGIDALPPEAAGPYIELAAAHRGSVDPSQPLPPVHQHLLRATDLDPTVWISPETCTLWLVLARTRPLEERQEVLLEVISRLTRADAPVQPMFEDLRTLLDGGRLDAGLERDPADAMLLYLRGRTLYGLETPGVEAWRRARSRALEDLDHALAHELSPGMRSTALIERAFLREELEGTGDYRTWIPQLLEGGQVDEVVLCSHAARWLFLRGEHDLAAHWARRHLEWAERRIDEMVRGAVRPGRAAFLAPDLSRLLAHELLFDTVVATGQLQEATRLLEEIRRAGTPLEETTYVREAQLMHLEGRTDEALARLDLFLERCPDHNWAPTARHLREAFAASQER
jgi:Protein kinase domain